MKTKTAAFVFSVSVISAIVLLASIGDKYSKVTQAGSDLNASCNDLKQKTIDVKNAFAGINDPTKEQFDMVLRDIQSYNNICSSKTGEL